MDLEASKYQHAEYRISIYGRKQVEWDILAAWYCQNKLYSDNVLWLIQVCFWIGTLVCCFLWLPWRDTSLSLPSGLNQQACCQADIDAEADHLQLLYTALGMHSIAWLFP